MGGNFGYNKIVCLMYFLKSSKKILLLRLQMTG